METANGWRAVWGGGGVGYGTGDMRVQSMGKMGKDFCPNFRQTRLENFDRRSFNDGKLKISRHLNANMRIGHRLKYVISNAALF